MIRELAAHTADKKNVIGYQIDNETKHHGNMGKEIQKLFLDYLKQKYITTDRFNDTLASLTGAILSQVGMIFQI